MTCPGFMYQFLCQFDKLLSSLVDQYGFGYRRPVAQRAMWPDLVVMLPPVLGKHLHLLQGVEDLSIEGLPGAGCAGFWRN